MVNDYLILLYEKDIKKKYKLQIDEYIDLKSLGYFYIDFSFCSGIEFLTLVILFSLSK
jgi:hypothetical protein